MLELLDKITYSLWFWRGLAALNILSAAVCYKFGTAADATWSTVMALGCLAWIALLKNIKAED